MNLSFQNVLKVLSMEKSVLCQKNLKIVYKKWRHRTPEHCHKFMEIK